MDHLRNCRKEISVAGWDFGGHKVFSMPQHITFSNILISEFLDCHCSSDFFVSLLFNNYNLKKKKTNFYVYILKYLELHLRADL